MYSGSFSLEDRLARLLSRSHKGLPVEKIRTNLQTIGSLHKKSEIVRALNELRKGGVVQLGVDRRWKLRRTEAPVGHHADHVRPGEMSDFIHAIRSVVRPGRIEEKTAELPKGNLEPNLKLLPNLLSYYQACLRISGGGRPIETLANAGKKFLLLVPEAPWWPNERKGSRLFIPLNKLSTEFQERLAKANRGKILIGYPNLLITPADPENSPCLKPVATFRCAFVFDEKGVEIDLPAGSLSLNPDWLKEHCKYFNWSVNDLRSWLLFEDTNSMLAEEDGQDGNPSVSVDLKSFVSRLAAATGVGVQGQLDPGALSHRIPVRPENGIYNILSLCCEESGKFVGSSIADYDRLLKAPQNSFKKSVIGPIFGETAPRQVRLPVCSPLPIGESQLLSARSALEGPITVVTGPPGTGKSQVIVAMIFSAVAEGKSVLFAARQHRALDAVQERLNELTGERRLMVRANDSDQSNSFNFGQALQALLTRADGLDSTHRLEEKRHEIANLDLRRWHVLDGHRDLAQATNSAAGARLEREKVEAELVKERVIAEQKGLKVSPERMATSSNLIKTLIAKLLKLFGLDQVRAIGSKRSILLAEQAVVEAEAISNKADAEVKRLKLLVADFQDDPVELTKTIESITKKLIPDLLDRLESMTAQERQTLTNLRGEVAIKSGQSLPKEAFEIILRHMPVWSVTTLAAGSRIPLEAGLFDYIIFDEAAQTDIGSALPLLYRGKNAVVVGDPQQLAMISNLDPRDERVLLGQNDLLRSGIGQFSQGQTSLFDLVTSLPNAQRYMLTDHFRCHPEIAAYINEAFYGRRLTALTDVKRLKIPPGMSAGLHWTDITGEITRRSSSGGKSGSAASEAEAQAIALEVERLTQTDYVGTIGIVTFFDYQAQLITKAISRKIPPKLQDKHRIKVFTANKFQGDERDVIMMSLCMHPDMPRGAKFFIQKEKRLLNVAVSRARAICHIFGDMDFAGRCGIGHIEGLARKVKLKKLRTSREERDDDRFDSIWERRLYEAMTAAGLSPIPQYPVGGRFLDLALVDEERNPPLRIDVEVDGVAYHQDSDGGLLPTDLWRNYQLQGLGWKVLRFWVYELRDDMEGCVERIRAEAAKR